MKLRSGHEVKEHSPEDDKDDETKNRMVNVAGYQINYVILGTYINSTIYATSFWVSMGALPYLSKSLGADPVTFGYLQTAFAVTQLCGGPLFGRFGDLYGSRAAMMMGFVAAAASYSLMAVSYTLPLLFLSRLPSVMMHVMQACQMVVTDLAEPSERANALARIGLPYGVGMVVGPFIGGILTSYSQRLSSWVAAAFCLIGIYLCYFFIPVHTKHHTAIEKNVSGSDVLSLSKLINLIKYPNAKPLILIKAVIGVPVGVFQAMFAIVAIDKFGLTPAQNGYMMSYVGCIIMLVQAIAVGYFVKRYSEGRVMQIAAFVLIFAYIGLSMTDNIWQMCAVIVPLCVGGTLMQAVISSSLTHCVTESETGAMLGINMAVNSLLRTISPTLGGLLLHHYGFSSIGWLGFFNCGLVFLYLTFFHKTK